MLIDINGKMIDIDFMVELENNQASLFYDFFHTECITYFDSGKIGNPSLF